jgi:hypothetical protein
VPGVESVSWASNAPLWAQLYRRVTLGGQVQQDGTTSVLTLVNTVDLDYFKTLGVALRRGRDFSLSDRREGRAITIVNDTVGVGEFRPHGRSALIMRGGAHCCSYRQVRGSDPTKFSASSAPGAWAKSTAHATRASIALSR